MEWRVGSSPIIQAWPTFYQIGSDEERLVCEEVVFAKTGVGNVGDALDRVW